MIMKLMKKISAILLTLCLCIPCFSLVAHAADGKISFTDPETCLLYTSPSPRDTR